MSNDAADSAVSPVVRAAERLVERITGLAAEVEQLRSENRALRREMREAIALFQQAIDAGGATGRGHRRAAAAGRGRRKAHAARGPRGRATPPEVTKEVVRAVLAKLGEATASQIAAEITGAGAPVNGRAIRFLAEAAGAQAVRGDDGQRRYHL